MFMEERLTKILELLKTNKKVLVKDLSKEFNVTESMIRKDLNKLKKQGLIERTYGGAILPIKIAQNTNITNRLEQNNSTKHIIAEKAFNLINDGDTIFLDITSINFILAKLLSESQKKITLVTNMVEISTFFNKPNLSIELICIGGVYNKNLGGVIGTQAIEYINNCRFTKAFIGSCGINLIDNSIYNFDLEEGNTKKSIISSSKEIYLLVENEKFNLEGSYKFATLNHIDYIITEENPTLEIIETLDELGIILY